MTYNPAYYLDLFAAAGFAKEKDLVAILAPVDDRSLDRLGRIADGVRRREKGRLVVRPIRMDRFAEDLAIVKEIYNRAWEKNWGFVPMTSEEIDAMAKKLKPLLYPPWVLFVELNGTPVAFHLAIPDYNLVLNKLGGSLFPFGWLKFLLLKRKIDRCRTMALGVLPEYRKQGLRRGPLLRGDEGRGPDRHEVGRVLLDARGQPRHPEAARGLRRADLPALPDRLPAGSVRRVEPRLPPSQPVVAGPEHERRQGEAREDVDEVVVAPVDGGDVERDGEEEEAEEGLPGAPRRLDEDDASRPSCGRTGRQSRLFVSSLSSVRVDRLADRRRGDGRGVA